MVWFLSITKEELEERIAKLVGRNYCLLVGRATTAIYLAIKAFDFEKGNIIIPSIVCPNPILSVLYNKMTPKFCDVNLKDYTIDVASFEENIDENTRAVIPINLYGYPANYEKLIPICRKNNIKIIEDAAQSFGGFYNNRRMGSFGEVSVISFGHTKIIDVESGGALLADDSNLLNNIKIEYEKLNKKPNNLNEKGELYRALYYALQPFWQEHDELYYLYSVFPTIFKSIYLYKFPESILPSLTQSLKNLDQEVNIRKKNAKLYFELLKDNPNIILPQYEKNNGVLWRFSFLINGNSQIAVSNELRKRGFDISNWYPSTHKMFLPKGEYDPLKLKNSDYLEKHIFNLWVHSGISNNKIKETCQNLLTIIK